MKPAQRLPRFLVALVVLMVWLASPGCGSRSAEGAPVPTAADRAMVYEPQIPEYDLLISRRRQAALERTARLWRWSEQESVHEATPAQRKQVHWERVLRREQLTYVADLVPTGYRLLVLDVAGRFEVDPRIVAAVGTVESQWSARALGRHGDSGLMQILPGTAAWIAGRIGLAEYDLYDPLTNLTMGTWYLYVLWAEHGSWDRALAAYNGGPKAVRLGDQHPYVGRVMQVYRRKGVTREHLGPLGEGELR
ncbi:MAG: lytic transglycosylase domain-containing protein [Bacillota bacterium]